MTSRRDRHPLRVGTLAWPQGATWPQLREAALAVDDAGLDSLWTWDHLHAIEGDPDQEIFEGWTLLAAWAAITTRTQLGLMVGANTFRNPGLTAKEAVTVDHISGGRAWLGIGGAWFDHEHEAHGIDFGSGFGQRLDWLEEAVTGMAALLAGRGRDEPGGRPLPLPGPSSPATSGSRPGSPADHDRRRRREEDAAHGCTPCAMGGTCPERSRR